MILRLRLGLPHLTLQPFAFPLFRQRKTNAHSVDPGDLPCLCTPLNLQERLARQIKMMTRYRLPNALEVPCFLSIPSKRSFIVGVIQRLWMGLKGVFCWMLSTIYRGHMPRGWQSLLLQGHLFILSGMSRTEHFHYVLVSTYSVKRAPESDKACFYKDYPYHSGSGHNSTLRWSGKFL